MNAFTCTGAYAILILYGIKRTENRNMLPDPIPCRGDVGMWTLDADGIVALAKALPNNRAAAFPDWFLYSDNTIDAKSKQKAYTLFESGIFESIEQGTVKVNCKHNGSLL